ncbi:hypothetical protein AB6A40_000029 [Gnathostoma spinigerum]|uniref:Histone acetyltransferase n=1 Tax=Gnathostoma spinigerum TaxID=75299 RepID=A0ABD6EAJ6_9BILA
MKSKRERYVPPFTPFSEVKVGETFIVLRRAPNAEGVCNERCVATIVEVRNPSEDSTSHTGSRKRKAPGLSSEGTDESDIQCIVCYLVTRVSQFADDVLSKGTDEAVGGLSENDESPSEAKKLRMYYVHYDGMDRRLDEWVERERIVERASPSAVAPAGLVTPASNSETGTMTRSQRRIHEEFNHVQKSYEDMDATTAKLEKEHAEMTKVKNIEVVRFGEYEIDTWYVSPYPSPYSRLHKLYVCEYCMAYMKTKEEYFCHMFHYCDRRQPPGDEIYRKGNISVFEVDGRVNKAYCQCLCLLSKLFLDHKTLFFDVETFLFYVLCEVDAVGAHVVGHFSKERLSSNNLACIMVLPPFQRKGYGKLLIQLSYELSSREGVIGTPEKPLSDLGKVSYRSYWWWVLLEALDSLNIDDVTVSDLSTASGIAQDDIISTLQTMQLIKYWKGDHVVRMTRRLIEHCKSINMGRPPKLRLDPSCLKWWPKPRNTHVHGVSKLGGIYS